MLGNILVEMDNLNSKIKGFVLSPYDWKVLNQMCIISRGVDLDTHCKQIEAIKNVLGRINK